MSYLTDSAATAQQQPDIGTGAGIVAVTATSAEIESLRGVTDAAADVSECVCPEPCERDHANE